MVSAECRSRWWIVVVHNETITSVTVSRCKLTRGVLLKRKTKGNTRFITSQSGSSPGVGGSQSDSRRDELMSEDTVFSLFFDIFSKFFSFLMSDVSYDAVRTKIELLNRNWGWVNCEVKFTPRPPERRSASVRNGDWRDGKDERMKGAENWRNGGHGEKMDGTLMNELVHPDDPDSGCSSILVLSRSPFIIRWEIRGASHDDCSIQCRFKPHRDFAVFASPFVCCNDVPQTAWDFPEEGFAWPPSCR